MNSAKKKVFSLQYIVTLSITSFIIILSSLFLYMAYHGMKDNIMSSTKIASEYITNAVNRNLRMTLLPSEVTLKMLKHSNMSKASTLKERLDSVELFATVLEANPIINTVVTGYETGEFVFLRRYEDSQSTVTLESPENTKYILQTKTLTDNKFIDELWFYDENFNLLKTKEYEDFNMDPRTRPWFNIGKNASSIAATRAYIFFDTKEVGITLAQSGEDNFSVNGISTTSKELSKLLNNLRITSGTKMVIIDETIEVLAYPDLDIVNTKKVGPDGSFELSTLEVPIFDKILEQNLPDNKIVYLKENNKEWFVVNSKLNNFYGNSYNILIAIPAEELFADVWKNLANQGTYAFIVIFIILVLGWFLGKQLVRPITTLTNQVAEFNKFNFSAPIKVNTYIKEVQNLGNILQDMAKAIIGFRKISKELNQEINLEKMLNSVLTEMLTIVQQENGAIYLYNNGVLDLTTYTGNFYPNKIVVSSTIKSNEELLNLLKHQVNSDTIFSALYNREKDLIGVLCISTSNLASKQEGYLKLLIQYIDSISSSAAIAIETRQLIRAQKSLLDGIIQLIADAIDTKSHYTGGHCKRVPELSLMLIEQMEKSTEKPFDEFNLNPIQEEEFRVAAWMHDCGKITTPEYVVDKATKLETIYNRIHEIRTRFEVLYRDETIKYLESLLAGMDEKESLLKCQKAQEQLKEDFEFIAKCNIGSEFMADEDIEKLLSIGSRTWLRYFNNNLGLSRDEEVRQTKDSSNNLDLPVLEKLLSDKPSHLVEWTGKIPPVQKDDPNNTWGFDMKLPKYMYNYGELYNLSIKKGTLTTEERFKINDHIVQTLCMLSSLPLPKNLSQVPNIASNHHETLDGTGYPRKLKAEDMPLTERVVAIADIFEALTAADRPYKKGKTLSESLDILSRMVREGHLDKDIYNLLLTSGVCIEYAKTYLSVEQINITDFSKYLIK